MTKSEENIYLFVYGCLVSAQDNSESCRQIGITFWGQVCIRLTYKWLNFGPQLPLKRVPKGLNFWSTIGNGSHCNTATKFSKITMITCQNQGRVSGVTDPYSQEVVWSLSVAVVGVPISHTGPHRATPDCTGPHQSYWLMLLMCCSS